MNPKYLRCFTVFILVVLISFAIGCGTGSSINALNPLPSPSPTPNPMPGGGSSTQSSTVFVIVMENKNYGDVVGSASMPYFNSLISQGALATKYYADVHPSIGNYFVMTAGVPLTIDDSFTGTFGDDNVARELVSAGKTWKVYAENIPSVGYIGGDAIPYLKRHNPFSYYTDITTNPAQAANMVPYTQLATDLSSGSLPNLAFIVPNEYDNGHSCPGSPCDTPTELKQTDTWLQANLPTILNSASMKGTATVVITWDESANDFTNGGGQVATLFLGPQVKAGFQSTSQYQHQDLLKMICSRAGLASAPGAAAQASTMSEFFK